MQGIYLELSEQGKYLDLVIQPDEANQRLDVKSLFKIIADSEHSAMFLFDEMVQNAYDSFRANGNEEVRERIAERRDAAVKYRIAEDQMSAVLSLTAAHGGITPSLDTLMSKAKQAGIVRGLSRKRLDSLRTRAQRAIPGDILEDVVAKGLPSRSGKPSKLKPLVPNALERILRPQSSGSNRVDMRNLGDIICVKVGTELLRRLPPTEGRAGYTVSGAEIPPDPGHWEKFRPGDGTRIADDDENLLIANITGMPKYKEKKMWVDDTFICNGVNVGTGHINYDGAVLVNGDVTEKMNITATGDVTINGFVESANIHAGGDIIITEGAMGKVNDASTEYSTRLTANGSVHIQHGQGLDISCSGNVTIGRQLAYSRIVCGGSVTVGPIDNPNGNLFACEIQSHDAVEAGTLGAVSGSNLTIDFSPGFNTLLERKDTLDELLQQLKQNNSRHLDKMELIRNKRIHSDLKRKFTEAEELLRNEIQLLQWLELKSETMRQAKESYQADIKLVANKRLYPGVVVKLNNRTWRADREYARAKVFYEGHQWQYEPLL